VPIETGEKNWLWLQVNEELTLEQVIKQVQKLPDVLSLAPQ